MADTKLRLGLDETELARIRRTWKAMRAAVGSAWGIANRRGAGTAERVLGLATASLAGLPPELALSAATAVAAQVSTGVNLGVPGSVLLVDSCVSVRRSGKVSIRQVDGLPFKANVVGRDMRGRNIRGNCFLVVERESATLIVPDGGLVRTADPEKAKRLSGAKPNEDPLVCRECGSYRVEPSKPNPYGFEWYCPVCIDGTAAWPRSKWLRDRAERGFSQLPGVVADDEWGLGLDVPRERTRKSLPEPAPNEEPVCCHCGMPAWQWDRPNDIGFTAGCKGTCGETFACESASRRLQCRNRPEGAPAFCE